MRIAVWTGDARDTLPLSDVMIDVRNDVLRATGRKQVPWDNSSLTGQFYFKPLPKAATGMNVPDCTFGVTRGFPALARSM